MIHNFVLGGIVALAVFILRIISTTREVGIALFWILKIFPMYCLCEAIVDSAAISLLGTNFAKPATVYSSALEIQVSGSAMIFLVLQAIVYPILVILIELNVFTFCFKYIKRPIHDQPRKDIEDDDVINEHDRVSMISPKDLAVRAFELRKVYNQWTKPLIATKHLSFGLEYGDCFALLGINGAGKTTSFKMLTGEIPCTGGIMQICDYNVNSQFSHVRRHIGYCPQFDTIFPHLSVEEHLYFYA